MNKVYYSFGIGGNIGELTKGLYCSLALIETRAEELETQVITNKMISERKIRDFLHIKYRYSEVEQELLLMHMKNNKIIEICQVTIKDETTEEEVDHRAVFCIDKVDENEQKNLKLLELEINLYTLSDAAEEIEVTKTKINELIKQNACEESQEILTELLKNLVYAEEVWVNVARSISMIEEQVQAFKEVSEVTIQLLIRQSRRDIFFYEKWRNYLNKWLEGEEDKKEDCWRVTQTKQKLSLPQWIRKVEINNEEIQKEINLLLAEEWAKDSEEFIKEFLEKIQVDIKIRETFNMVRRSPQNTETIWNIPNSYMDTITKYQEFFCLDENYEPMDISTNPFEPEFRISRVRKSSEWDEDASPEVRKSVIVQFDSYADYSMDEEETE